MQLGLFADGETGTEGVKSGASGGGASFGVRVHFF